MLRYVALACCESYGWGLEGPLALAIFGVTEFEIIDCAWWSEILLPYFKLCSWKYSQVNKTKSVADWGLLNGTMYLVINY